MREINVTLAPGNTLPSPPLTSPHPMHCMEQGCETCTGGTEAGRIAVDWAGLRLAVAFLRSHVPHRDHVVGGGGGHTELGRPSSGQGCGGLKWGCGRSSVGGKMQVGGLGGLECLGKGTCLALGGVALCDAQCRGESRPSSSAPPIGVGVTKIFFNSMGFTGSCLRESQGFTTAHSVCRHRHVLVWLCC